MSDNDNDDDNANDSANDNDNDKTNDVKLKPGFEHLRQKPDVEFICQFCKLPVFLWRLEVDSDNQRPYLLSHPSFCSQYAALPARDFIRENAKIVSERMAKRLAETKKTAN